MVKYQKAIVEILLWVKFGIKLWIYTCNLLKNR
jgi:hypothetical protein